MDNQKKLELQRLLWMANVQAFFPDKTASELDAGYQQWLGHRQDFLRLYREHPTGMADHIVVSEALQNLRPGILFTFHFGPYRLLPRLLVAAGCRVTLLVSATVLEREQDDYRQQLSHMGLSADYVECLSATDPMVLRKLLHAVAMQRVVLVFLDANESVVQLRDKERSGRLRVAFGASHFYWRSNLLKLAHRFALPVQAIYLRPDGHSAGAGWQPVKATNILNPDSSRSPERLLEAFAALQQTFQEMIALDWTAWENWAIIHHYLETDDQKRKTPRRQGSWMLPFAFRDKAYLFDLSSKRFYPIIANKEMFD
ncbi:hypothetical protein ABTW24_16745 [Sphingobacterium thalpophilum]|uniref:Lipid A biosynthesis lauroyl acyltransferase n=1 Tax=Sphingobacterium thalpophilum TaxID=259 RepID=A0ABV4HFH6_9SPHI